MTGKHWLLAPCFAAAACSGGEQVTQYDWRVDDRLVAALADRSRRGHFNADTGDMLPVMVEKLATGRANVQNHYRGELAAEGARCVALIEDLIQRYASSRTGTLVIGNALGVLGLCDDPASADVVRRMLSHPAESVRSAAIRAMVHLAEPGDYEALHSLKPLVSGQLRGALVRAMGRSDPERLARDLSGWVEAGDDAALLLLGARSVAEGNAGASLAADVLSHDAALNPDLRPFLAAARASVGDAEAIALLRAGLSSEDVLLRIRSLEAASLVGLHGMLVALVTGDTSETLRVLAAESVARLLPDPAAMEALRAGTRDEAASVRQACLRALLQAGDPGAGDQFIGLLSRGPSELGPAFRAVRGLWGSNPGLSERSAKALMALLESMEGRTVREREPWLQALGQVPSRHGAVWLLDLARAEEGVSHQLSTHRWVVMQISNGGPLARGVLMAAWRHEDADERRMDYLWAASLSREQDALEFLLDVVMDSNVPDYERLFAADCLTQLGDTARVAPLLKRACLTITDEEVRPAFESLLWTWYA